ncbi:probable vacuolar protein sorting-associated protein 54 [Coccomyxa sp. Obi]|nr:probable vacuolar protein sorting-associated protein 54 [Coccomyxa sp. Obi]
MMSEKLAALKTKGSGSLPGLGPFKDARPSEEKEGHLHARRLITSEEELSVTESPLARTSGLASTSKPTGQALPKIRRASITQQDARLYAMTQGLVPMLNTPSTATSSTLQTIGSVCWPFGNGADLSQIPPPLPPGLLPDVKPSDFNAYKQAYASRLARFQAVRQSKFVPRIDSDDFVPGQTHHVAGEGLVQAMRAVPLEFFAEDFSLQRPETWQAVCSGGNEDDRTAKMEQYANYLDTVETHLLQEIAARSSHFFEAAGIVQDLRAALTRTYQQVAGLRKEVGDLKGESGVAVFTHQHLERRRRNLTRVLDHLKVVEGIAAAQEALELLIPAGDFAGALDVLSDLTAAGTPMHVVGLHAFRDLPQQLAGAEEAINTMMEADFLRVAQNYELDVAMDRALSILRSSKRTDSSGDLQSSCAGRIIKEATALSADGSRAFDEAALLELLGLGAPQDGEQEQLRDGLMPLVVGLRRTGRLSSVLAAFRDAAALKAKAFIREVVERGVPVLLSSERRSIEHMNLADRLQVMGPSDFVRLLEAVLIVSGRCLGHAARVRDLVLDFLVAAKAPRALQTEAAQGCTDAITTVSEAAHACWIRLLNARPALPSRLQLAELHQLLGACEALSHLAESAGARPVLTLRNAVQAQCKSYLDAMHTHSLTQLTGLLEQEQWSIAFVALDFQRSVDALQERASAVNSASADSIAKGTVLATSLQANASRQATQLPQQNGTNGHVEGADRVKAKDTLRVGEHEYHVVAAVLMMLGLLEAYLQFQDVVPNFGGEVAHRVVELLKVFNSRTCQLVLGAGALAAAGLRSITAKHLALAAQCVGAVMALHPSLSAAFTGPLPAARRAVLLPDFERVLQDLRIHRTEIHSKLVAIMRERLMANLKQLPSIAASWGQGAPGPKQPSQFAQTNAKQLRILSQVLSPLLLDEELHYIFGRVSTLFSKSLADAYARLEPLGPAWEAQCHADTHLLLAALKGLPLDPKTADSTMDHLATLCNLRFADPSPSGYSIPVPLPPPSAETPPSGPHHSRVSPRRTADSAFSDQGMPRLERMAPPARPLPAEALALIEQDRVALPMPSPSASASGLPPLHSGTSTPTSARGAAPPFRPTHALESPSGRSVELAADVPVLQLPPRSAGASSSELLALTCSPTEDLGEGLATQHSMASMSSIGTADLQMTVEPDATAPFTDSRTPQSLSVEGSSRAQGDASPVRRANHSVGSSSAADPLGATSNVGVHSASASPARRPAQPTFSTSLEASPTLATPVSGSSPPAEPLTPLDVPALAYERLAAEGNAAAEVPSQPSGNAAAGSEPGCDTLESSRQLMRKVSELAYVDRDPLDGSPTRRFRPTADAEVGPEQASALFGLPEPPSAAASLEQLVGAPSPHADLPGEYAAEEQKMGAEEPGSRGGVSSSGHRVPDGEDMFEGVEKELSVPLTTAHVVGVLEGTPRVSDSADPVLPPLDTSSV